MRVQTRNWWNGVCFALSLVACCGCGGSKDPEKLGKGDFANPLILNSHDLKVLPLAFENIIEKSQFGRVDEAYNNFGKTFVLDAAEGRKEFPGYETVYDKIRPIAEECRDSMKEVPPNTNKAVPKIQEMKDLAKKLPGPDVKILADYWQ